MTAVKNACRVLRRRLAGLKDIVAQCWWTLPLPLVWAGTALGQGTEDLGAVADNLTRQTSSFAYLIGGIASVAGFAAAAVCGFKLWGYGKNPNDPSNSLKGAGIAFLAAALFIGLPEVLDVGVSSMFGGDAETVQPGGSGNVLTIPGLRRGQ